MLFIDRRSSPLLQHLLTVTPISWLISCQLNKVSPLRMAMRRQPKPISHKLLMTAISSKREHRRMEVWKQSRKELDRLAYKAECHRVNKLINESCHDYNSRRINACSESKSCWAAVRELLHSADLPPTLKKKTFSSVIAFPTTLLPKLPT